MRGSGDKWAQRILDQKSPETFFVLRSHAHQPWVREAARKGATIIVIEVPWQLRFWWWIKRVIFRRGDQYANGQASKALRAPSPSGLQGPRNGSEQPGGNGEDELF